MKLKSVTTMMTLVLFPLATHANVMTTDLAINALNLKELALTYNQDKIAKATGSEAASQADALLVDMGIITTKDLANTKTMSLKLTSFVNDYNEPSGNYIGNLSDKNIVERVLNKWSSATIIQDKKALKQLNSLIDHGYTTGYNVINMKDDSNFNTALMIRYGHNNIKHATQLLYLMKSEGFDPKVQLTPKSSAFEYLPEWGEPNYSVTTLESGKMVSVVKEYNLDFEFENTVNKNKFMALINKYAKKDTAKETGLIAESWWQPFYRSYTKTANYSVLIENNVTINNYKIDLLTLPAKAKLQAKQVSVTMNGAEVTPTTVWVNPSFYRYMNGDFK
ncbi:hypothetical protein HWV00_03755 [Moritella sp. 24]|uniref:hypothetical protein n=1 Tax=Moritella sp. 24 TaxID=2746230 RepID=UPI001BAA95EB|nr:hypothetical protein [Moritella sp. 24]QUM75414.1 hypothetical protein HWV00_03755 [Moritella sp. 24]